MQVPHSQDPAPGANLVANIGRGFLLVLGLEAEQATHMLSLALFMSIQVSHSHEPVGGAFKLPLMVDGAKGLDVEGACSGIRPHRGEEEAEVQEGLGL
jgi:hypothetical protein